MRRVPALLVMAILLASTEVSARKIQNDFDVGVDFSVYTTYAWQEGFQVSDSSLDGRIIQLVDAELSAKYLRRIQARPDLYVVYYASAQEMTLNTREHGYSFGLRWQWGGGIQSDNAVQVYPRGTLVVDVWEARTRRLIWRGVATDVVDKGAGKVAEEIQKMFLKYPPPGR